MHAMTWALAGRMAVWTILALIAYALLVYEIGRFLGWLGSQYPVALPRDPMKYEGRDLTPDERQKAKDLGFLDDDERPFALDTPDEPPKRAA